MHQSLSGKQNRKKVTYYKPIPLFPHYSINNKSPYYTIALLPTNYPITLLLYYQPITLLHYCSITNQLPYYTIALLPTSYQVENKPIVLAS